MSKIFKSLILLGLLVIMPTMILAQITGGETVEDLTKKQIIGIIMDVGDLIYVGVLSIAVIFILWAGYDYVTASGDDIKITTARKKITGALTGIIIAALAKGLVSLISDLL